MDFINIHTHQKTTLPFEKGITNLFPEENHQSLNGYFSCGIHPWYIKNTDLQFSQLVAKLQHQNCLAIGECGIDRNVETPISLQKTIFQKHIELSEKHHKPLIIHAVKSHQEIIQLKKQHCPTQIWLVHGVNKRYEIVQQLVQHQFFISFGKALLTNKTTQESFVKTPLEALFLETDDASISIEKIYQKASELKQIPIEELTVHLSRKFEKYFLCHKNIG
ncbi:MAG: TatD family hydrolase [Flavobacteriaceae bacterium]|nr:TatD family hydrolase [Flavobacteriaceae bacterium]